MLIIYTISFIPYCGHIDPMSPVDEIGWRPFQGVTHSMPKFYCDSGNSSGNKIIFNMYIFFYFTKIHLGFPPPNNLIVQENNSNMMRMLWVFVLKCHLKQICHIAWKKIPLKMTHQCAFLHFRDCCNTFIQFLFGFCVLMWHLTTVPGILQIFNSAVSSKARLYFFCKLPKVKRHWSLLCQ